MTILEILEAHTGRTFDSDGMYVCQCGHYIGTNKGKADRHRDHVAEVLEQHMQEREAAVIAGLAELLDEYRSNHDIAECAAPVEGETGRQSVIDKWETICEEPAEWLRQKSKEHNEKGFEYLLYVAYEAWQTGFESGWAEAKDPGVFVNNAWDAKTPNPYADEEPTNGR